MSADVAVVGLGIHPFGRHEGVSGLEMAAVAARGALGDAGVGWDDVDFAVGGSDAAGNADTSVAVLGLTGVPFINVRNGCATGGSALTTAHAMLASGAAELALVVGFDKHPPGAFNPLPEEWGIGSWYGETGLMLTTQFFAMKIQRYMSEYGISESTLAKVASKAFHNGSLNPHAWRRRPLSEREVLGSKMVNNPLTQYMFCSPGEGAVALVLARGGGGGRARGDTGPLARGGSARGNGRPPVYLRSVAFRTRRFGSFEVFSPSIPVRSAPSPTAEASRAAFELAGIGPEDVDVAQLQDTESGAEVMHLAETGLCEHGEQEELIQSGATAIGGRLPVNTDGGCLANGEPIGASGLRQVHEVVLQLRGEAGERQVPGDPRVGFTQVYGAPGVSACAVLGR
jgi:acetyl-CoA acetyltransferase